MKLVEILARQLEEWPSVDGVECGFIVQESDGELYTTHDKAPTHTGRNSWWRQDDDDGECGYLEPTVYMKLAEDWETAVITRTEWETERARIKGEKSMPKPNKDGWIRHRGGNCPSNVTDRIDVRFRDGEIGVFRCPITLKWVHEHEEYDIMAWRPHKPEQKSLSSVAADGELWSDVKGMPSAKCFEGPIQWRDRILEIDAASKEEEARHCAAMEAYDAERASLVAKLKAEGFALIQSDEPNVEEDKAQQDIAHQDMSDPANWRAGDMIISLEEEEDISIGGTYHITEIYGNDVIFRDNAGDQRNRCASDYKWHSRPTN